MRVIYLLQCPCGAHFVGKTKRAFKIRISERIEDAKSGFFKTVIGRHIAFIHNLQLPGLQVFTPHSHPPCDRGGDWDWTMLQAESRWIFKLKADKLPGLNDFISYAPFL